MPADYDSGSRKTTGSRLVGSLLVALSSVGFASLPIFGKLAYGDGAEPYALLAWRFGIAAIIMLVAAVVRGRLTDTRAFPPLPMTVRLLLVGAFLLTPEVALYFVGLQTITAGMAETLIYLYPAWVVLIGAVVLKQRPTRLTVVCVVVAVLGAAVTVGGVSGGDLHGELMVVAASAMFATYVVVASRVIPRAGTLPGTALVLSGAAVGFTTVALLTGSRGPSSAQGWFGALAMALLGTVLAFGLLSAGLARIPAATAAVISTLEPVVAVLLGSIVLGEPVGAVQVIGMLMIMGAVGLLLSAETRGSNGHKPLVDPLVVGE